jgi:ankyrin repeat protein
MDNDMWTRQQDLNNDLLRAVEVGTVHEVQNLLQQGASFNYRDYDRYSALFLAVIYEKVEIARLLLSRGANLNVRNYRGETPLMFAKSPEMVNLLAEFGVNPLAQNSDGVTAFELFLLYKKTELLQACEAAGLKRPTLSAKVAKRSIKILRELSKNA